MNDRGESILLASDDLRDGFITGQTFEIKPVRYSIVEEKDPDTGVPVCLAMVEGCIVLGTEEEMQKITSEVRSQADAAAQGDDSIQFGVGITGRQYRWPDGLVPYEIHANLTNQNRVTQAIAHWQ